VKELLQREDAVLAKLIRSRIGSDQEQPVLKFERGVGDCVTRSFAELYANANRLAAYLLDRGMQKGDRFAFLLQNHPETVEALIAASITGCILVPIDPRTKGEKLAYVLSFSGCRGLLFAAYNAANIVAIASQWQPEWALGVDMEADQLRGMTGEVKAYAEVMTQDWPEIEIRTETGLDPIEMIFTSGTTGDPKGILKPNAQFLLAGSLVQRIYQLDGKDVLYSGLSLTHANAQFLTVAPALVYGPGGMRAVISQKFSKSRFWDIIRHHNCTYTTLLGGMTTALYAEEPHPHDADNPMRVINCAGMPAVIWKDFATRFGVRLVEGFGAAEGGMFWNADGPVGSFGNLHTNLLHEARIVDEEDRDVAPGEVGELIWRNREGSPVSVHYFNNPEASAAKTAGGWFRTGDIVHSDAEGWLYFDYRKGGGIRRNGDFVNPGFVEKVIAECDNVSDVFVYGTPAASGAPGEKDVVAAIVAADVDNFDPQPVFARCREKLEPNFVPTYLQVVEEIPKTASEKPQERFLLEGFAPDASNVFSE